MNRNRITIPLVMALLASTFPSPAFSAAEVAPAASVTTAGVVASDLRAVTFANSDTGWAAGANGVIIKTVNGGETWTTVRSADTYSFRGIDHWAGADLVAVDYAGRVASSIDGGGTWANVNFTPYSDMDQNDSYTHNDVVTKPGTGTAIVAAGDDNPYDDTWIGATSFRTTTSLAFWKSPLFSTEPHTYYNVGLESWDTAGKGELLDLEYVAGTSTLWGAGIDYWAPDSSNPEKYPLFKSTDDAATWTKVTGFGATDLRLEGVAFGTATDGIVVGRVVGGNRAVRYTGDGGTTWKAPASLGGTSGFTAVDMSSASLGWATSSDGTIWRTANGGGDWIECTVTGGNSWPLHDVTFVPGTTTGWAVGDAGTVLLTTDGLTWRPPAAPAPVNTAPVANADSYTTAEDTPLVVPAPGVLGNDTDAESGALKAILGTSPANGSLSLGETGSFTYTPSADWNGTDSFTYRASDGALDSATPATVTITVTPVADPVPRAPIPVYRFYNFTNNTHFFTASEDERAMILATWPNIFSLDGPAYYVNPANNTQPLYRFYNTVSRSHFYTANPAEKNQILKDLSHIFSYDGETYSVNPAPAANSLTAYRFYNKKNGSHFYTTNEAEVASVQANLGHIYQLEGPAFWIGQ